MSSAAEVLPPERQLPAPVPKRRAHRAKVPSADGQPPADETRFTRLPDALKRKMWQPGQSGNPLGMSRLEHETRSLARSASPEAMAKLIEICLTTDDDRVAVVAADKILERAFGKPKESSPNDESEGARPDVSRLNPKDRDKLKSLLMKAVGKKGGG